MINESGRAIFSFHNIQLPDSISNEPASHRFVTFKIYPHDGLKVELSSPTPQKSMSRQKVTDRVLRIERATFSPGLYVIHVSDEAHFFQLKVIAQ